MLSKQAVVMDRNTEISRISKANKISTSARTTIPKKVMDDLQLDVGDGLVWETYVDKGKKYARLRKVE